MTRSLLKPSGSQAYPMTQKKLCKLLEIAFCTREFRPVSVADGNGPGRNGWGEPECC